jgi:small subunit ribosomal protein S20
MANHPSALKRHRQSVKRRDRNRAARSAIRTAVKKTSLLIQSGDLEGAKKQASVATRLIDKASIHGVLHKKTAARTISRLHQRVNSAATAA